MKKSLFAALAAAALLASCTQEVPSLEGKVTDATMSTVTIVTAEGESISVNTLDSDPNLVPGVLVGDFIRVTYEPTEDMPHVISLEIVEPSYYRLISGTWLNADGIGFTLAEDGSASSAGYDSLLLKEWALDGEELALTGDVAPKKSATVVYVIAQLDSKSLVLNSKEDGSTVWSCTRR